MAHLNRLRVIAVLVSAGGLLNCSSAPTEDVGTVNQSAVGARFGTMCQRDFQNGWQNTLPNVWDHCAWFNNELDDTDQKIFYYNLQGGKWQWENTGDDSRLDAVNLFYSNTHGGASATDAIWAMWDQGSLAVSSSMRLGDENWGLSIFASYACQVMKHNDSLFWTRWDDIFRGGLRIAVGSHDTVFDSSTTNEVGEDFADNLQGSWTIKSAWPDAVSDWNVDNDAAVATVGTNSADCWNRQNNMKWQNYPNYPVLRDNSIGWYCHSNWDNL
jgi:hypothetical protein